jgi:hypothetical protein
VKQQPVLTNFPSHVFATARRRFQAEIRRLRESLATESLSGYAVMFDDVLPTSFLRGIDPTRRNRHFGHIPVFWSWIAQVLEANASCSKALGLIQSWCRAQGLPVPSSDTSSYSKARCRVEVGFLEHIDSRVCDALGGGLGETDRWRGFTLKAIDGSSSKLADTEENQEAFPQPSGQKPGCGFPVMGFAGLLNLGHGGWEAIATGPHTAHDLTLAAELTPYLSEGDLLLADRAYCSYAFIAAVRARGAHCVMRLHQRRDSALDWRKGRKLSAYERLVTWRRPYFSTVKKHTTREEWEALPESMEVRLIRLDYEDRSGKRSKMTVVTTLTDAQRHDGVELHALYARRWDIELRLRDIKTTLGFEMINAKSPAMARKTLTIVRIAYNLMRLLMQRGAREAGVPTGAISFKETLDLATSIHESFRSLAGKPRKKAAHMSFLVEMVATRTLDQRPFRHEPRAVKRRPKPFPMLTAPRHEFVEIPHRSSYRKSA